MDNLLVEFIDRIQFGEIQEHDNMVIVPLLSEYQSKHDFLTLNEAMEQKVFTVKEVNESGSVPELSVTNSGGLAVLLLDGEELAGAKQNRVLNTTILIIEKSDTLVPVSCTEQGRWQYTSREFNSSDHVMSPRLRKSKLAQVKESLDSSHTYRSDQSAIWDGINDMSEKAHMHSPTSAMADIHQSRMTQIDQYVKAFTCVDNQMGMLVFSNGEIAGVDIVTNRRAFKRLYEKVVSSYAIDTILEEKKNGGRSFVDDAKTFLNKATQCDETKHKSIGHGWDHRLESEDIVGSALVHEDDVIHMSIFKGMKSMKSERMSGYRSRRKFRQ